MCHSNLVELTLPRDGKSTFSVRHQHIGIGESNCGVTDSGGDCRVVPVNVYSRVLEKRLEPQIEEALYLCSVVGNL